MREHACTNVDCINKGALIVDSNVVRYILAGTMEMADTVLTNKNWAQRLSYVEAAFRENFEALRICSCDARLHISEPVLNEELDVRYLASSARLGGQSRSVYNTSELRVLRSVVENCLDDPVIVPNSEIAELRSVLRESGEHLEDHDAGLIRS